MIQKATSVVAIAGILLSAAMGGSAILICEAAGSLQMESILCDTCNVDDDLSSAQGAVPDICSQSGCVDTPYIIFALTNDSPEDYQDSVGQAPVCDTCQVLFEEVDPTNMISSEEILPNQSLFSPGTIALLL